MEDALLACELGADALGFVFWPGSPRFIDPEQVRAIVAALPPFVAAGRRVRQSDARLRRVCRVDSACWRGAAARRRGSGRDTQRVARRLIKSVAVSPDFDAAHAVSALSQRVTMLLDAHDPIRRGGTGRTIDWRVAAARGAHAAGHPVRRLDAGERRRGPSAVHPYAVDVSSGVEASPGVKDPAKLRAFFAAVAARSTDADARPARLRTLDRISPMLSPQRDPDARGYYGAYGGRFVPETLVAPVDRARGGLYGGPRATRRSSSGSRRCCATTSAGRRRSTRRGGSARRSAARASSSSARTSRTPAPTRSTTRSVRACSRSAWASDASSPRPAPASTASRPPRCARCSASTATSTWAPRTWSARRSTSSAWSCSAPTVRRVDAGAKTLKDAINEAMRDWVANVADSYYLLGSVLGPHPYPLMVREFQSVIGQEARRQIIEATGESARHDRRLRRRRQQRDGDLRRVHRRSGRQADWRRSRRPRHPAGRACGPLRRRQRRRAAGHAHLRPAGRGRQHRADALGLGRPGLRGGRPRARVAARLAAAPVRLDRRRCGAGGVSAAGP